MYKLTYQTELKIDPNNYKQYNNERNILKAIKKDFPFLPSYKGCAQFLYFDELTIFLNKVKELNENNNKLERIK